MWLNSKIYEKEPQKRMKEPHYNKQILPVPFPFVISRILCKVKSRLSIEHYLTIIISLMTSKNESEALNDVSTALYSWIKND